MEKALWRRWAKVPLSGSLIIGTGVFLFYKIVPTDEELIRLFSPEVRANYERNRELRQMEQQELMRIVQRTSKSSDPIWMTGSITSPFDKETRGKSAPLVDYDSIHQREQKEKNKKEVEEARRQFFETEKMINEKSRSWWKLW